MTLRPRLILVYAVLACLLPGAPAFAHAHLKDAVPSDQATVSPGPQSLRLEFTEGVEPGFCSVKLAGADEQQIGPVSLATAPADARILIATLPARLAPGRYTVTWHAVSVDTHQTDGHYGFTVAP